MINSKFNQKRWLIIPIGVSLLIIFSSLYVRKPPVFDYTGTWLAENNFTLSFTSFNKTYCDYRVIMNGHDTFWCFGRDFFSNLWWTYDPRKDKPPAWVIYVDNPNIKFNGVIYKSR